MKTIVVATDGSDHAAAALDTALEFARQAGAGLCCVSVDDSFSKEGIDPDAKAAARTAAARAHEQGIDAEAVTRVGPAVDQILAAATDANADLIVVGSRGRGRVSSAILGSVAYGLIRHGSWPILVVTAASVRAEEPSAAAPASSVESDA